MVNEWPIRAEPLRSQGQMRQSWKELASRRPVSQGEQTAAKWDESKCEQGAAQGAQGAQGAQVAQVGVFLSANWAGWWSWELNLWHS